MGFDNNVYVQIGLVMLIGLAAKNAILIVEFAKAKHEGGASLEESALESARLRFRPILMTAFAFILGVVPMMLAIGRRRGRAERDGHGRVLGHADRHRAGRVHHSGQLHLCRGARSPPTGREGDARRSCPARKEPIDMTPRQIFLLCAVGCLAAGCTVGPDYKRPELAIPPVYRGADAAAAGRRRGDRTAISNGGASFRIRTSRR